MLWRPCGADPEQGEIEVGLSADDQAQLVCRVEGQGARRHDGAHALGDGVELGVELVQQEVFLSAHASGRDASRKGVNTQTRLT